MKLAGLFDGKTGGNPRPRFKLRTWSALRVVFDLPPVADFRAARPSPCCFDLLAAGDHPGQLGPAKTGKLKADDLTRLAIGNGDRAFVVAGCARVCSRLREAIGRVPFGARNTGLRT